MAPSETRYLFPTTSQQAVEMLSACSGHALVIAGGTDILLDIQKGRHAPHCLVDVTRIPELTGIEIDNGWATVGAAVPFVALREHPYFAEHVHALADAAASVGALAIQSSATWAGNLVQAMPAADGAIVAVALDAEVRVLDTNGELWLPAGELYAGPGRSRVDSTRQLITHIRFRIPAAPWGTAWRRVARRPALVLPTLNCAAKVVLDDDRVASAAVAMGPVGPCPVRAHEAEAFLTGRVPDREALAEAAALALCDAVPRTNVLRASREYRLAVLPVLAEEALSLAVQRARSAALKTPMHPG